jgi:hypothetical protein
MDTKTLGPVQRVSRRRSIRMICEAGRPVLLIMSVHAHRPGGRTEFTMEDEDKILRWLMYHHPEKTNWKSRSIYQELVRATVLSPSNA